MRGCERGDRHPADLHGIERRVQHGAARQVSGGRQEPRRRALGDMDRDVVFLCQHLERARVVGMLMRDKDGAHCLHTAARGIERLRQRTQTAPRVDENGVPVRADISAVALRAGIERAELQIFHM